MSANLNIFAGEFEWDNAKERKEKREQGVANYYKGQKTITELIEKERAAALLLNNVIQHGLHRLEHGNVPGNWCTSVGTEMPADITSVNGATSLEAEQCTASNHHGKGSNIESCNVSKNVESANDSEGRTCHQPCQTQVSEFVSPIAVQVPLDVSSTAEVVSSKICLHKCKAPCTTCISAENKGIEKSGKKCYGTNRVKVTGSRSSQRLQHKEDLCQMITIDKSRNLTMAAIEKHYPEFFICESEVCIDKQRITDQIVGEGVDCRSLKRKKYQKTPKGDKYNKEENINPKVDKESPSKYQDNEKLQDNYPSQDNYLTPALCNARKRRTGKLNVPFKTPDKAHNNSLKSEHISHSDDVTILQTPPNKYHLRSMKESSDDDTPRIMMKSPDSPWKSTPPVQRKKVKQKVSMKSVESSTPVKWKITHNHNESRTPLQNIIVIKKTKSSTPKEDGSKQNRSVPKKGNKISTLNKESPKLNSDNTSHSLQIDQHVITRSMYKKDREELKVSAAKINTTKTNSAKQRDIPANKKFQGVKNEADNNYPDKGQHKKLKDKKRQPKGKGVFECALCSKKFAYKENVKVHINAVHMIRKYSCKYCGKTYSRPRTLKGHIKVYHEGHRFKCTKTNCNESFQRTDQLKGHMMSHQGKYLFICSTCGKGYNHKSNYEVDCNTHLVKKPYKCGQCEAYSTNYSSISRDT